VVVRQGRLEGAPRRRRRCPRSPARPPGVLAPPSYSASSPHDDARERPLVPPVGQAGVGHVHHPRGGELGPHLCREGRRREERSSGPRLPPGVDRVQRRIEGGRARPPAGMPRLEDWRRWLLHRTREHHVIAMRRRRRRAARARTAATAAEKATRGGGCGSNSSMLSAKDGDYGKGKKG